MSLRSRILGLYLAFAFAPMVALGVGQYVQSVRSLRALVEARLQATSEQAASEIRGRIGSLRTSLRFIAQYQASPARDGTDGRAELWHSLAPAFARIELMDAAGGVTTLLGSNALPEPNACLTESDRLVAIRAVGAAPGSEFVGWVPAAGLLTGDALDIRFGGTGRTFLFDRTTGDLVYEGACGEVGPIAPRSADDTPLDWAALATGTGLVGLLDSGRRLTGAYTDVDVPGMSWVVVVATQPGEFTAQYARWQQGYLAFVIFIALAAGGAFLILAQHFMGSLEELTVAAERIGQGDLSPWLPPPGSDEVGRLSNVLGHTLERLKAALRQSRAAWQTAAVGGVASQLSHEIRNPLSSIRLNLQSIARESSRGRSPADLHDVVELCLREIDRLNDAVSSVLEFGSPRPPEQVPCSVGTVVDESVSLVRPRFQRANVEIRWVRGDAPDDVLGEAAQLRAVFLNLLLNAADALDRQGGVVRVWLEDASSAGEVRVHVADDGPGIPPELRAQIFEPFFTTRATGTGIGLPIAVQTVEAHGGRLYLEKRSELERGAEFVVALPLREQPAEQATRQPGPERRRGTRVPTVERERSGIA